MEQKLRKSHQKLPGAWRVAVIALAIVVTFGLAATDASAQGGPAGNAVGAQGGPGGQRVERNAEDNPLEGIVDQEQIMADALGITVEELESAQEAGTRVEDLIDELGLDQETVRQAVQEATEAAVEQAIEDGLISEDDIPAKPDQQPGHSNDGSTGGPLADIVDSEQITADALGITVEELEAAQEAGTSIQDLIDELGLDHESVREAIQEATEDAIEQAIDDGLISEDDIPAQPNPPARPEDGQRPGPGGPGGDDADSGVGDASTDGERPARPDSAGTGDGPMQGSGPRGGGR